MQLELIAFFSAPKINSCHSIIGLHTFSKPTERPTYFHLLIVKCQLVINLTLCQIYIVKISYIYMGPNNKKSFLPTNYLLVHFSYDLRKQKRICLRKFVNKINGYTGSYENILRNISNFVFVSLVPVLMKRSYSKSKLILFW